MLIICKAFNYDYKTIIINGILTYFINNKDNDGGNRIMNVETLENLLAELLGLPKGSKIQLADCGCLNGRVISALIDYSSLKGTNAYFDYKNQRILHFTDLNATVNILTTMMLRASNYNSFKDPLELQHACNLIGISNYEYLIKENKKYNMGNSFTIKTNNDVLNCSDYDYLWERYANKKYGVAFEFEIINITNRHFPLKMVYLDNIANDEILTRIKNNNTLKDNKIIIQAIIPLLSAYKEEEYKREKEVRLHFYSSSIECEQAPYIKDKDFSSIIDKSNNIQYQYNTPFTTPKKDEAGVILKLHRIYIYDQFYNDTITIISNVIRPFCDDNDVELITK
jgi:hypothetical protein